MDLGAMAMKRYSTFPKTEISPSDYLASYLEYSFGEFHSFVEMQLVYSGTDTLKEEKIEKKLILK